MILQIGFILSVLAHYGITIGEKTTTKLRKRGQPVEKWIVPTTVVIAGVLSVIVFLHNRPPTEKQNSHSLAGHAHF